jgi:hypothetical protein
VRTQQNTPSEQPIEIGMLPHEEAKKLLTSFERTIEVGDFSSEGAKKFFAAIKNQFPSVSDEKMEALIEKTVRKVVREVFDEYSGKSAAEMRSFRSFIVKHFEPNKRSKKKTKS